MQQLPQQSPQFPKQTVAVEYYQQPVSDPGTGGDACDLDFSLSAVPSIGNGTWTMTSGPGTVSFSPDANTPEAVVTATEYGTYSLSWTEVNFSCSSSAEITVNFYQQPVSNAGSGGNFCGLEADLNAIPDIGAGYWSLAEGPGSILFTPDSSNSALTVTGSIFGNYSLVWTEMNGTCSDSDSIIVSLIDSPVANAGEGGDECDLDFLLNAVPAAGFGNWSLASGSGTAIFSPGIENPETLVTVDQYGSYEFLWTVENTACTSVDQITVVFHELPFVYAGLDMTVCEGSEVQLRGEGTGSFYWSPESAVSDSSIAEPFSTVDSSTNYRLTLTDQYGCVNSDEVLIIVRDSSVANAGPDQVLEYAFNTIMASTLDYDYESGVWSLVSGNAVIDDDQSPYAIITELNLGENILLWTVSNEVCPASSDSVTITVNDLKNPTLMTPNQDGKNDNFVIQGLVALGKTELKVFDRRGAVVYENADYDNSWNGVDYKGNPLPDGTYFYVLDAKNGKALSGFIVLRR